MSATLDRPRPPFPYDLLPALPSFTLTSTDFEEGGLIPHPHTAQGGSVSPQLSWSGAPEGTRSYVVSCFDPDAPTPSGFWHWTILDLDASVTSLPTGLGESDLLLDGAAFHIRNDAGTHAYYGPQPPAGDGPHRYIFAVHALDVDSLELDDEASAASVALHVAQHALGRALLTGVYATPGAAGAEPFLKGEL